MAYWVRVDENDYFQELVDFDPTGKFVPSIIWRQITDEMAEWVNFNFKITADNVVEVEDMTIFENTFKSRASGARYRLEQEKLEVNGNMYWIDRMSLMMLKSVKEGLESGALSSPAVFKSFENEWVDLTLEEVNQVIDAIIAHKQRCFKAEKNLVDRIASLTTVDDFLNFNVTEEYQAEFDALA